MSNAGSNQTARILVFVVIGILLGAAGAYVYLSPLYGQVSDLTSKNTQLQTQLNQLTSITEYKIGASMPLTGALGEIGVQWRTVLEMARDDLNAEMTKYGIKAKFTLVIQDDKSSETEALKVAQNLGQTGIKVIIGPAGSSQIKADKSYVDDNKIVIISPSSTAPTLAIPNDYIFRSVGSDVGQSLALAALLKEKGVNKIVIIHRNDDYGVAFATFLEKDFKALGGAVSKLPYDTSLADYASEVAQLSQKTKNENADAVVLISYDTDGVNIISHAKDDAQLTSIKWFSSEGINGATSLLNQDIYNKFVEKTGFLGTRPVFKENPLYLAFAGNFKIKTGYNAPVFSANLYDAIQLAGWSIIRAGSYNGPAIKEALPKVAEKMYGTSGWNIFDINGDKLFQDYSIWTIKLQNESYQYVDIGSYAGGTISLN